MMILIFGENQMALKVFVKAFVIMLVCFTLNVCAVLLLFSVQIVSFLQNDIVLMYPSKGVNAQ